MQRQNSSSFIGCKLRNVAFSIAATVVVALPAQADTQTVSQVNPAFQAQADDQGASQRIDLSGKLRMLSQRAVAAGCYVQSGIMLDDSTDLLDATTSEFEIITYALAAGDPNLGIIGAEENRRTLAGLNKIADVWANLDAHAATLIQGDGASVDLSVMAEDGAEVLKIAQKLVTQISGQYLNPNAMSQADAMRVDLAGRQRMLAQRISKNTCLIAAGVNVEASRSELQVAKDSFGGTLTALTNGMAEVGVQPPPTGEISAGLSVVNEKWSVLAPIIEDALAGNPLTVAQLEMMFVGGNVLTVEMNKVVGMYVDAAGYGS